MCTVHWYGSSGAMESALALNLLKHMNDEYKGLVHVGKIITDDDSIMRSHYKQVRNGGKLLNNIPEPIFLADPSHRVKVMCKGIFALVSDTKDPDRCKMIDAIRIKSYTSYYIAQNREGDLDHFVNNANAPIAHLFNNHTWCDSNWCWAKDMSDKIFQLMTK